MVTGVLLAAAGLLSTILILSVLTRTIRVYFAYRKFKKNSKGLFVLPFTWSPGGHLHQICFSSNNLLKLEQLMKKHGFKTGGGMLGPLPTVLSCDIELFKTIFVDEAHLHCNRFSGKLNLLIDEVEDDSIGTASDDQWSRIRKSVAPSFT